MQKIKILFIIPFHGIGGTEKISAKIMNELIELGFSIYILTPTSNLRVNYKELNLRSEIEILSINAAGFFKNISQSRKIIKDLQPDIIEGMLNFGNILQAFVKTKKTKTIYNIRSVPKGFVRNPILYLTLIIAQIRSSATLVNSPHLLKFNLNRKKNSVILNPSPQVKTNYARHTRIKPIYNVLTVSNLRIEKGLFPFLYFLKKLDQQLLEQYNFNIAGIGKLDSQLQSYVRENNLPVKFLGYVKNIESIYGNYDLYIHTSKHEGSPNALLEAIASGLPVISRDASYSRDLKISPQFRYSNFSEFEGILRFFLKNKEVFLHEAFNLQSQLKDNSLRKVVENRIAFYHFLLKRCDNGF